MLTIKPILIVWAFACLMLSCNENKSDADAYGNFEADEILISSETSGVIKGIYIEEGNTYSAGTLAYVTDSIQYHLKIQELLSQKTVAQSKIANTLAQENVYRSQQDMLKTDLKRVSNMLKDGAATQKQADDLQGQIIVFDKQISAVRSNITSIYAEINTIDVAIAQARDLLNRTLVSMPSDGTILEKYANIGEIATPGKPLYKLANLSKMKLRAYISGDQLSSVKLGQTVSVFIDSSNENMKEYKGTITWVANEAEFTPKNIQTHKERVSRVYAIKIEVPNDGSIKINMPAEVYFN